MLDHQRALIALSLAVFTFTPTRLHAQCGAVLPDAPLHPRTAEVSVERGGPAPFIIPTVVHIHYGGLVMPLGIMHVQPLLDQCNNDLRALNADIGTVIPAFAGLVGDLGVELRLATLDEEGDCMSGVLYHPYDPTVEAPDPTAYTLDTRRYLNIHIHPATNSFANFPSPVTDPYSITDVIVLSAYDAVFRPRSLAHELGHWAGLYHTFGNSGTSGITCGDDFIADTPETAGSPLDCDLGLNTCTPGVVENVQNFMDYSTCGAMFTQGQAAHAIATLADPGLVRAALHTAANLAATGVDQEPTCALTGDMHLRIAEHCSGTEVSFRALAEHQMPDSVRWSFPGGTPNTSTVDDPSVLFATSGTYQATLTVCKGGTCITVQRTMDIHVPDADANGLTLVGTLPFSEGFEGDFALPQPHMLAAASTTPTWQPFAQAGHASARSLYVPAEEQTTADTNDLVIGNFDLSGLEQPYIRMKVATSYHSTAGWGWLDVLFHDQCSNIFQGGVWMTVPLNVLAQDNGIGFIPTSDAQWTTVEGTYPSWVQATSAQITIRLRRAPLAPGQQTEAFFLDDLYIGEAQTVTSIATHAGGDSLRAWPNPARDEVRIQRTADHGPAVLRLHDATGRTVVEQRYSGTVLDVDLSGLAPGGYVLSVDDALGLQRLHLVVQ